MNSTQVRGVNSTLSQVVSDDIQHLKQHLDGILAASDQTFIENLITETELLLEQVKGHSKTYQEKHESFHQLTQSWFDAHRHYKDIPEAIELIKIIDHLTNYSIAYSYLLLSLSLINEGKIGEYKPDLERVVSGYFLLSEIVDVFVDFFSVSELKQIDSGARKVIASSGRDLNEYFKDAEISHLTTRLRAYSSLIVLKIEEYIKPETKEREIETTVDTTPAPQAWWKQIVGTFAEDSIYDEAMRLGREYRDSLSSDSTEL